jgi:hypothetical protein
LFSCFCVTDLLQFLRTTFKCRGRSLACSAGAEPRPRLCIACIPVQDTACMHARPAVLSGCWLAEAAASSSVRACCPLQLQVCTQAWRSASSSACGERSSSSSTRRGETSHSFGPTMAAQRRFLSSRPTGAREMGSGLNWASFLGPGPLTAAYVLKPRDKDMDMNP